VEDFGPDLLEGGGRAHSSIKYNKSEITPLCMQLFSKIRFRPRLPPEVLNLIDNVVAQVEVANPHRESQAIPARMLMDREYAKLAGSVPQ
jgi:hypothetical protein